MGVVMETWSIWQSPKSLAATSLSLLTFILIGAWTSVMANTTLPINCTPQSIYSVPGPCNNTSKIPPRTVRHHCRSLIIFNSIDHFKSRDPTQKCKRTYDWNQSFLDIPLTFTIKDPSSVCLSKLSCRN